jgi:AcrR family transcriptional regulator
LGSAIGARERNANGSSQTGPSWYAAPTPERGGITVIAQTELWHDSSVNKRRPNRIDQILKSALTLFDRNGYHATGIDDIGVAAGLTGPAIYRHFRSKEEILARLITERATRSLERANEITSNHDSPEEQLLELISLYTDELIDHPELAGVAFYNRRALGGDMRTLVERLEASHIDIWVRTLRAVRPALSLAEARLVVQGMVGMTIAATAGRSRGLSRDRRRILIANMMASAMLSDTEHFA